MRNLILLALNIIILSSIVSALNVTLDSPPDNIFRDTDATIEFRCSAKGIDLLSMDFYTDVNGTWDKVDRKLISGTSSSTTFSLSVAKLKNNKYKWNCKATDAIEGTGFGPLNFTFTLAIPQNDPPECVGSFPDVSLNKNTGKTNVLNLNDYFLDDRNKVNFIGVSGDDNVAVTIKTNGFIDLVPNQNSVAVDRLYFIATDGVNSDVQCGPMKVSIVETGLVNTSQAVNQAPDITPKIPEQIKGDDVDFWTIDLDDYVKYDGDKSVLSWRAENVGSDVVNIEINNISHEIKFKALEVGTDNIVLVVADSKGLSDEQDLKVEITSSVDNQDDNDQVDSNENLEDEIEEESFVKIESHAPGSSDPTVEQGSGIEFSVEVSESGADIIWYVNGVQVDETSERFKFDTNETGDYKVLVTVSKGGEEDNYEWDLKVVGSIDEGTASVESEESGLCGNGVIEEGENCDSCVEDVSCEEDEECVEGECIVAGNKITGFTVKGFGLINIVVGGVIGVAVILLIIIFSIRAKNKKKMKDKKLSSFEPRIKEQMPEKKEHVLKTIENVRTPSSVEHVIGFIQSGLASGDSEKMIKKSLIKGGWNRKQIKHAFKSIKK